MEIKGKVHCFFEQSGTFKNEFIKLGIPSEDYDIQNNFNQTDHVIDLFEEIEKAVTGGGSVFDKINQDDLILAFFPCIMFSCLAQINITISHYENLGMKNTPMLDYILDRIEKREFFYKKLIKLCLFCKTHGLRLIVENPYSMNTYLKQNFIMPPSIIDIDRTRRGDFLVKPTAYWFFNCVPTNGYTRQKTKQKDRKYFLVHSHRPISSKLKSNQIVKSSKVSGICSEERSMISPDYARNFICDFILGKEQPQIDRQLKLQL